MEKDMERLILEVEIGEMLPQVTEAELAVCPSIFRCFNCQEKLPKEKLGGIVNGEFICKYCRPYVTSWMIGGMRKFDNRQKSELSTNRLIREKPEPASPADKTVSYVPAMGIWVRPINNEGLTEPVRISPKMTEMIQNVRNNFQAWEKQRKREGRGDNFSLERSR